MREPVWIREDALLSIQRRLIVEHGGEEGVQDYAALTSALVRPRELWLGADPKPDAAMLAAVLALALARRRPFGSANEPIALVILRTFLLLNGQDLEAGPGEKYFAMKAVLAGDADEEGVARWIRGRLVRTRAASAKK
jgi:death-on-curing protein